jgi:NADH-ubiquinone oxidoreductase chain 5
VAGVFLLIRLNDIFSFYVLQVVFVVGSLTILYRSICAIGQSDIKKIIAFSTTSQLRFMIGVLGIRMRILAFIHLCLHAFFKSLIFLTSRYFIHAERDTQDFRIIRIRVFSSKLSSVCLLLGSLSLRRFPFLARFYSKDLILENFIGRVLNRIVTIILFVSCILTIRYSFRLIIRSFKRVVSVSIVSKKIRVEVLRRSVRWNLIRSLLFVVCRGLLV